MNYILQVTDSLGSRHISLSSERRWWEIGRSSECQIQVKGSHVSRKQCTLLHLPIGAGDGDPVWVLMDGSLAGSASLNGTGVNEDAVQRKPIHPGDVIYLGSPEVSIVLHRVKNHTIAPGSLSRVQASQAVTEPVPKMALPQQSRNLAPTILSA